ncbi:hypothetical protein [Asticcacaulis sp. 201]|uniref:hypothetical protein n=1 Tax=Asticcacaulis sp. 201 TaxID=3028787 RepID=UPI002916904E|nr:hypothetical protein [Asticcacaulis sp. 201]MDV6332699.1 hypothetical protein [Asticcacaulis sp. 201]
MKEPVLKPNARRANKPRPSAARWRLMAAVIFTAVPAIALPTFIHHLYAVRPTVTDVRAGFVNPHFHNGIAYYFAHTDETLIRALSFWLLAGVLLLMFAAGQMMRRRLMQWLKPPAPEAVPENSPEPPPESPTQPSSPQSSSSEASPASPA